MKYKDLSKKQLIERLIIADRLLMRIEDDVKLHSSKYPDLSMRVACYLHQLPEDGGKNTCENSGLTHLECDCEGCTLVKIKLDATESTDNKA